MKNKYKRGFAKMFFITFLFCIVFSILLAVGFHALSFIFVILSFSAILGISYMCVRMVEWLSLDDNE